MYDSAFDDWYDRTDMFFDPEFYSSESSLSDKSKSIYGFDKLQSFDQIFKSTELDFSPNSMLPFKSPVMKRENDDLFQADNSQTHRQRKEKCKTRFLKISKFYPKKLLVQEQKSTIWNSIFNRLSKYEVNLQSIHLRKTPTDNCGFSDGLIFAMFDSIEAATSVCLLFQGKTLLDPNRRVEVKFISEDCYFRKFSKDKTSVTDQSKSIPKMRKRLGYTSFGARSVTRPINESLANTFLEFDCSQEKRPSTHYNQPTN